MRTLILLFILAIPLAAYSRDQASPPVVSKQAIDSKPDESTSQNETNHGSAPDWTNRINAVSTLVIAVFTICLFGGVIVQIKTSRNIERAWILASVEWRSRKWAGGQGHILQGNAPGQETTSIYAQLICKNEGRSPAWIVEKRVKFEIVNSLTPKPDLKATEVIEYAPEPLGSQAEPSITELELTAESHIELGKMGLLYGSIKYRDIFNRTRTTTFGYKIDLLNSLVGKKLERLGDSPRYNENT